jgi:hypothetical protein
MNTVTAIIATLALATSILYNTGPTPTVDTTIIGPPAATAANNTTQPIGPPATFDGDATTTCLGCN